MKIPVLLGALFLLCVGYPPQAPAQATDQTVQQAGNCSVNLVGSGTANLVCTGVDAKLAGQMQAILNGTRRNENAVKDISEKLDQVIAQMGGVAIDARQKATAGVLDSSAAAYPVFLSVGGTRFVLTPSANGVLFTDGITPLISERVVGGKMLVSVNVLDDKRDLVATLSDNVWKVSPPAVFDRNYTEDAVEIRDVKGKIVLQVVADGVSVHVAALLRCRSGRAVIIGPYGDGALMQAFAPGTEPSYEIPSICDYPSELHLGSCPGVEALKKTMESRPGQGGIGLTAPLDVCR